MEKYSNRIREILLDSNLDKVTAKRVRKQLEQEFSIKFPKDEITPIIIREYEKVVAESADKKPIEKAGNVEKQDISAPVDPPVKIIPLLQDSQPTTASQQSTSRPPISRGGSKRKHGLSSDMVYDSDEEDGQDVNVDDETFARKLQQSLNRKLRTTRTTSTKPAKQPKRNVTSTGKPKSQKSVLISDALAQVIGSEDITRYQVTAKIWEYIKGHELQDPSDKRYILCDEKLQKVMGKTRINMFYMPKELNKHIYEKHEVMEYKDKASESSSEVARPAKKAKVEQEVKKEKKRSTGGAPRVNGFTQPLHLSAELAAVLNTNMLARTQVVKKIWEYIKEHNLQDPKDRRFIMCDDKLRAVLINKRVNAFQMNKFLSKHMWKPSDVVPQKDLESSQSDEDEDESGSAESSEEETDDDEEVTETEQEDAKKPTQIQE